MAAARPAGLTLGLLLCLGAGCREEDMGPGPLQPDLAQPDPATDLPPGEEPAVIRGAADRLRLVGRVVSPKAVLPQGEVLIVGDRIACVAESCFGTPGYDGATVLRTAGTIYPGLVDAHNHTQYNYLPPWRPEPPRLFDNRGQWAARADYKAHTASVNDGEGMYGCQQIKYGEVRALIGGTTTIQGTGSTDRKCYRTLVHNAEYGNELGVDRMRTNIPGISGVSAADAAKLVTEMKDGTTTAYVIHLSEGIDETSRKEFDLLETRGLVLPQTVVVHGTALGQAEFQKLGAAGAKLVWSPLSNLVLYGKTTDVKTAMAAGIKVALAPDWTPSGSPSLLAELRVAKKHSQEQLGGLLDAKKLTEMVTSTAAEVLALDKVVGRLEPGLLGDVLVLRGAQGDAYEALIAARPEDVRLVAISGRLRYGDPVLMDAVDQKRCEPMSMCGADKRICVPDTDATTDTLNEDLAAIRGAIQMFYAMPYRLDVCE